MRRTGARAGRDVVKVRLVLVQRGHHLLRTRAVERRQLGNSQALVGDRQQGRPLRCADAGAANLDPAVRLPLVLDGIVDGDAGRRRRVVGDVGIGALGRRQARRHHPLLVRRLRFVRAGAAARAAPADLA